MTTMTRADSRIDLTPRKAAPRIPRTTDEIDIGRIPTYAQSDCPQIVSATYGGKTRRAIVIVSDPARRLVCVLPFEERAIYRCPDSPVRLVVDGPITLDDMKVRSIPQSGVPAHIASAAMTWLADRRDAVRRELTEWIDDINQDNVLAAKCAGCDDLADHGPLPFSSGSQHAA